jgi:hypothetical protein
MGLIMRIARDHRRWAIALWTVGAVPGITFPSIAQAGFFDFLFPHAAPAPQPFFGGPGHMPHHWGSGADFRRHAGRVSHWHEHRFAAHRKLILADKTDHPKRPQAPTDLMDDDSLRRGDAVMTQAGIRIFVGYSGDHHRPEDFQKVAEVKKLSQRERNALAALDTPGSNTIGQKSGAHGMVTGRSATGNENKLSVGETITDPNGRTIRYVGP